MPETTTSILNEIREMTVGVRSENPNDEPVLNAFDTELKIHINTALARLWQLGVGPEAGYAVTNEEQTWEEFLGDLANPRVLNGVKTYVYQYVKLTFDSASMNTGAQQALQEQLNKLEWLLNVAAEEAKEDQTGE